MAQRSPRLYEAPTPSCFVRAHLCAPVEWLIKRSGVLISFCSSKQHDKMSPLKQCNVCRQALPADDTHFYRDSRDPRKHRNICKTCWKHANAARYAKNPTQHCRNVMEDTRNRQRLTATLRDLA